LGNLDTPKFFNSFQVLNLSLECLVGDYRRADEKLRKEKAKSKRQE
jgi:hypothetical protein